MPRRISKATRRQKAVRWAIAAAVLLAIAAIVYFGVANHWLTVDSLRSHRDALLKLIHGHYLIAVAAAIAVCTLLITTSAPVSGILTFACGMLFGRWVGTAVALISETAGAAFAMLVVRYLLKDFVSRRVQS